MPKMLRPIVRISLKCMITLLQRCDGSISRKVAKIVEYFILVRQEWLNCMPCMTKYFIMKSTFLAPCFLFITVKSYERHSVSNHLMWTVYSTAEMQDNDKGNGMKLRFIHPLLGESTGGFTLRRAGNLENVSTCYGVIIYHPLFFIPGDSPAWQTPISILHGARHGCPQQTVWSR